MFKPESVTAPKVHGVSGDGTVVNVTEPDQSNSSPQPEILAYDNKQLSVPAVASSEDCTSREHNR